MDEFFNPKRKAGKEKEPRTPTAGKKANAKGSKGKKSPRCKYCDMFFFHPKTKELYNCFKTVVFFVCAGEV